MPEGDRTPEISEIYQIADRWAEIRLYSDEEAKQGDGSDAEAKEDGSDDGSEAKDDEGSVKSKKKEKKVLFSASLTRSPRWRLHETTVTPSTCRDGVVPTQAAPLQPVTETMENYCAQFWYVTHPGPDASFLSAASMGGLSNCAWRRSES